MHHYCWKHLLQEKFQNCHFYISKECEQDGQILRWYKLAEVCYFNVVILFYTNWKSGPGEWIFMPCQRGLKNPFLKMRMNKERAGICSVLMNPKPNVTSPWPFMHLSWKRPFWYIPLELKMPIFQFQRSSSLLGVLYDPALAAPHWCCLTVLLICHWLFTVFLANVSERDNSNDFELCVSSDSGYVPCAWCSVSGSKLIKSPGNFRLLC